jgi:hypothetical protein
MVLKCVEGNEPHRRIIRNCLLSKLYGVASCAFASAHNRKPSPGIRFEISQVARVRASYERDVGEVVFSA